VKSVNENLMSVTEQLPVDLMMQSGVPIILNDSPAGISEQILWFVKNCNLNFCVYYTPFSLDIRIKKSFSNKWENQEQSNGASKQEFLSKLAAKDDLISSLENKKNWKRSLSTATQMEIKGLKLLLRKNWRWRLDLKCSVMIMKRRKRSLKS
jgi:hypothetical protein